MLADEMLADEMLADEMLADARFTRGAHWLADGAVSYRP